MLGSVTGRVPPAPTPPPNGVRVATGTPGVLVAAAMAVFVAVAVRVAVGVLVLRVDVCVVAVAVAVGVHATPPTLHGVGVAVGVLVVVGVGVIVGVLVAVAVFVGVDGVAVGVLVVVPVVVGVAVGVLVFVGVGVIVGVDGVDVVVGVLVTVPVVVVAVAVGVAAGVLVFVGVGVIVGVDGVGVIVGVDGVDVVVGVAVPVPVKVSVAGKHGPAPVASHVIVVTKLSSAADTFLSVSTIVLAPVTLSEKPSPESRSVAPFGNKVVVPENVKMHDRNDVDVPDGPVPRSADAGGEPQPYCTAGKFVRSRTGTLGPMPPAGFRVLPLMQLPTAGGISGLEHSSLYRSYPNESICSSTAGLVVFLSTTSIGITAVLAAGIEQVSWTPTVPVSQSTSIWMKPVSGLAAPALCVPRSPPTVTATASTAPAATAPIHNFCDLTGHLRAYVRQTRHRRNAAIILPVAPEWYAIPVPTEVLLLPKIRL